MCYHYMRLSAGLELSYPKYAGIFRHSAKILAKASMRNTNFKKYAGLFRQPPNVANWIRLRRATSNAHVFNKISYAGLSKWSQRVGKQKQLIIVFAKPKPPQAMSRQSRVYRGDRRRLCDGGGKVLKICRSSGSKNAETP